jgi:PAS domain S-box-containing protein
VEHSADPSARAALIDELRELRPEPRATHAAAEVERLLHELEVHQIELQMQNRQLREAQQLLEESRSRYADLFDFAPVGYCSLDEEGGLREVNLTAAGMLGIDRTSLRSQQLMGLLSEPAGERVREHLRECFAEGRSPTTEVPLRMTSRGPLVVQMTSAPMFGIGGRVVATRTTLTDISELKYSERIQSFTSEASEALSSSLEYEKTLANVAKLAVPLLADICFVDLVDDDGRLRRLEIAFSAPHKSTQAAGIGEALRRVDSDCIQASVLRSLSPVLLSDQTTAGLATADIGAAGPARSVMCLPLQSRESALGTLTLITAESGRVYSAKDLGLALDIARRAAVAIEHARLYKLAQQATRMRDEVLAVVAHDLKSPLTLITLGASALLNAAAPHPDRRKSRRQLQDVRRGAERMRLLIDDLVDVASLQAGRLSLSRSVIMVEALLADAESLLGPLVESKGLRFTVDTTNRTDSVVCDRERTMQVLSNLIDNAIKFSPAGGLVRMWAELEDSMVRFSVRDQGPGIDPALLPHVFERSFRGRSTTVQGSGLGLHIAKVIVEAQDGQIHASSAGDGGCVVSFTLPAASPITAVRPAHDPRPAPTESLTSRAVTRPSAAPIWVVDEDPEIREALVDMLSHAGYGVVLATGGRAACEQLQRHSHPRTPSLLLLDVQARAADDAASMQTLLQLVGAASIPILLIGSRDDVVSQAETIGAVACMRKPLQLGRLLQLVEAHRR